MKHFFKIFLFFVLIAPVFAYAQSKYQPLVGIPGVGQNTGDFNDYLQAIYATSISLAALLAVIKIVIAGVKWMTTDIVEGKSDAKKDIEGAVLGLIVILSAVLILYIINPNIGSVSLSLSPAPTPPPTIPLPDSAQALQVCTERDAGGCSVHTCDTTSTLTCAEVVNYCEGIPGFSAIEQFGDNNIVCLTNFTTITNVDLAGADIFAENAITSESQGTDETSTEAYNRIAAELEAAGKTILLRATSRTFGKGAVSQRTWESRCQRAGGSGVVYVLNPAGVAERSVCTQ